MVEEFKRCPWCAGDAILQRYHDEEWGVPIWEERVLFEMLCLEGAQAGLSWRMVLNKREGYRLAFANFDAAIMAGYDPAKQMELSSDTRIIRNRRKIQAFVVNARSLLALKARGVDFVSFLWGFVGGYPRQNRWLDAVSIPAQTGESRAMSAALSAAGFHFVGPTICYAFMQASGMVNDHLQDCFRYRELLNLGDDEARR